MHNFTATPPNNIGYFSPQTAAVNFCEIDYTTTTYIAEFINTLTNVTYVYLAAATATASTTRWNIASWPWINIALLLVGIGSAAFHATLQHSAQMADELSMYMLMTTLNYRIYTYRWFTSLEAKRTVKAGLAAATAYVGYFNITATNGANDTLHLTLFVSLITTFWPRVMWLIYHDEPRLQKERGPSSPPSGTERQSAGRRDGIRGIHLSKFRLGAFCFLSGFGAWLIDGLYCHQLRDIRARIGLPLAWLLELHGVWHVLTAVGAGIFVQLVADLTCDEVPA